MKYNYAKCYYVKYRLIGSEMKIKKLKIHSSSKNDKITMCYNTCIGAYSKTRDSFVFGHDTTSQCIELRPMFVVGAVFTSASQTKN